MRLTDEYARTLAENGPLVCVCGNRNPARFAYVAFGNTVIAACKECERTFDYDLLDARGTWKASSE